MLYTLYSSKSQCDSQHHSRTAVTLRALGEDAPSVQGGHCASTVLARRSNNRLQLTLIVLSSSSPLPFGPFSHHLVVSGGKVNVRERLKKRIRRFRRDARCRIGKVGCT